MTCLIIFNPIKDFADCNTTAKELNDDLEKIKFGRFSGK